MNSPLSVAPQAGAVSVPIETIRNPRSRRYILRVTRDGKARITIPRGGTVQYALEFAQKNRDWIAKQLVHATREWKPGDSVYFRGVPVIIEPDASGSGGCILAGMTIPVAPNGSIRQAIEWKLRALAVPELIERTRQLAADLGLQVSGVQVRDQKLRWGSCSSRARISLNWRLIQTPEFVRDYIIVHELMHLLEMNHSERFWDHVARVFPGYPEAEEWLRRHARFLR